MDLFGTFDMCPLPKYFARVYIAVHCVVSTRAHGVYKYGCLLRYPLNKILSIKNCKKHLTPSFINRLMHNTKVFILTTRDPAVIICIYTL